MAWLPLGPAWKAAQVGERGGEHGRGRRGRGGVRAGVGLHTLTNISLLSSSSWISSWTRPRPVTQDAVRSPSSCLASPFWLLTAPSSGSLPVPLRRQRLRCRRRGRAGRGGVRARRSAQRGSRAGRSRWSPRYRHGGRPARSRGARGGARAAGVGDGRGARGVGSVGRGWKSWPAASSCERHASSGEVRASFGEVQWAAAGVPLAPGRSGPREQGQG